MKISKLQIKCQVDLNAEWFIAQKVIKGGKGSKRFSRPIVRISIISIALGLAVMIISAAIVTGFQNEIRDKVIGFGSHIQIKSFSSNQSFESLPVPILNQDFYPSIDTVNGVRHVQLFATKPGIIQTKDDIQGIIVKGVGVDFDWDFFRNKLVKGNVLELKTDKPNDGILVSKYVASKLRLEVGDIMTTYFIHERGSPKARKFKVAGIYETGLEDFDQNFILADIHHIRKLNNWGVETFLSANGNCFRKGIEVEAVAFGMHKNYSFNWGNQKYKGAGPHLFKPERDTVIQVIARDIPLDDPLARALPDTAWLEIHFKRDKEYNCKYAPDAFTTKLTTAGGSRKYYTGGFEVLLNTYEDLLRLDKIIYRFIGHEMGTITIVEQYPEIFSWLEMIDINVIVIVVLMILVAVINMTSTLLTLILEKTNMIGILKALGYRDWSVRKIFLYNAAHILFRGLLLGNLFGLSLCYLQKKFQFFTLPQENYYISIVPVNIRLDQILLLNFGTLLICLIVLIIPSYIITKIRPVRAIRFN